MSLLESLRNTVQPPGSKDLRQDVDGRPAGRGVVHRAPVLDLRPRKALFLEKKGTALREERHGL